jgi:Spy/CpxP family protein refolding chaperone
MTLVSLLTLGGLLTAGAAFGETEYGARQYERHMERGEGHGPGGKHHEHHAQHHGRDGDHGHHGAQGRSMGKGLFAPHWKTTLNPEQRVQLDQLRVDHAKAKAPLKAKIISIKTDLAVLATVDEPNTAVIQQRIDEILELKKKVMQTRYAHIAAVRKVLTPEQRPSYDMMVLKHAKKRKKRKRW